MRFSLIPFQETPGAPEVDGVINLTTDRVTVTWRLRHDGSAIIPPEADAPAREFGLWEHTCFEFFIGAVGGSAYLEYNQSPSGAWNSFAFSDLRTDMTETPVLALADWQRVQSEREISVSCTIAAELPFPAPWRVGLSAVVAASDRHHYLALRHGKHPDFHDPCNHEIYQ